MALHATHLVLRLQRGQQGGPDGDAVYHGAELEDDGLLLQAFGELRELVGFHGGLIDAGCSVRGMRGRGVFPVRRLTEERIRFFKTIPTGGRNMRLWT